MVEVLVALSIGAMVILGARAILENLGVSALQVVRTARAADVDANGERLLRALAGRLEIGTAWAGPFSGDERMAQFTSWCETPSGWLDQCRVTLAIEVAVGQPAVVARLSTNEVITLRTARSMPALRYLVTAADGGTWIRRWGSGLTAPQAIGVLLDGDTLIVRIGDRG